MNEAAIAEIIIYPRTLSKREIHIGDRVLCKRYGIKRSVKALFLDIFYLIWRV